MAALILAAALVAAASPATATPAALARWQPFIAEAAHRYLLPEKWLYRVMRAESGGHVRREGRPIRSLAGAIGLMQVMPATWQAVRVSERLGADPDDPHDNILAGAAYLRRMLDRFGYPGAFAAYNAGPARYSAYLAGRARLPTETVGYLAAVVGRADIGPIIRAGRPRDLLFALRTGLDGAAPSDGASEGRQEGLFAIRTGP